MKSITIHDQTACTLNKQINECTVCASLLPLAPKPIIQLNENAHILIIGQAPGIKAHESDKAWNDASGKRLREWLNMSEAQFYNPENIAIMPMGFCYPGKGKSGDLPPRKECAATWHEQVLRSLPNIKLTLLIGQYAQLHYLKHTEFARSHKTLTEKVRHTQQAPKGIICLPHPSPRNQIWLKKHPWFTKNTLPYLQSLLKK